MDGFPMTLNDDRCSRLFTMILNGGEGDLNESQDGLEIPYNTIFPRPLADEWDHRSPLNNLKWINVTNIHINQLMARDCTIDYSTEGKSWVIVAGGIRSRVSGNWSYSWESGMPVLDDSGLFDVNTRESGMTIIIQRFSKKEYVQNRVHRYDTVAPRVDTSEAGPDHVWRAFVLAGVPKSLVTITSGTQYAEFYNNLMKKYENEMKILWIGTMNVQLASMINHFCDDHLEMCDHLGDQLKALAGVVVHGGMVVESDSVDDVEDEVDFEDEVDEFDDIEDEVDEIEDEIDEIEDEFDEIDEDEIYNNIPFDEDYEDEINHINPNFNPHNEPDSEMDTDTVLDALGSAIDHLMMEAAVEEEEKQPDVIIVMNDEGFSTLFGANMTDLDDSEDDAGDVDGGVVVGEEESVVNEAE